MATRVFRRSTFLACTVLPDLFGALPSLPVFSNSISLMRRFFQSSLQVMLLNFLPRLCLILRNLLCDQQKPADHVHPLGSRRARGSLRGGLLPNRSDIALQTLRLHGKCCSYDQLVDEINRQNPVFTSNRGFKNF